MPDRSWDLETAKRLSINLNSVRDEVADIERPEITVLWEHLSAAASIVDSIRSKLETKEDHAKD